MRFATWSRKAAVSSHRLDWAPTSHWLQFFLGWSDQDTGGASRGVHESGWPMVRRPIELWGLLITSIRESTAVSSPEVALRSEEDGTELPFLPSWWSAYQVARLLLQCKIRSHVLFGDTTTGKWLVTESVLEFSLMLSCRSPMNWRRSHSFEGPGAQGR